jgi:hypothetical protein
MPSAASILLAPHSWSSGCCLDYGARVAPGDQCQEAPAHQLEVAQARSDRALQIGQSGEHPTQWPGRLSGLPTLMTGTAGPVHCSG